MQTFLPYENFEKSLKCLDRQRLGKQRVESWQIINILTGTSRSNAWKSHPAVLMWSGFENALKMYYNINLRIWEEQGYQNIKLYPIVIIGNVEFPTWLGDERFHSSHRAALLHKNSEFYSQFHWDEDPKLDYYWPITKEK